MTNETLSAQWRDRIAERSLSGMSVRDWCAGQNIAEHRYYYWHRKFSKPSPPSRPDEISWLALPASPSAPGSRLTVRVGAAAIEVAPGFDPALLSAIVAALG